MRITHSGFAFLLQDINAQIWTLLLQYLEHSSTLKMDPVDVLHFLFMLGSLELGQDYSTSILTETQDIMLEDLRDYGIVFQRKVIMILYLLTTGEIPEILSNTFGNFFDVWYHRSALEFQSIPNCKSYGLVLPGLHHP
jgi:Transcription factor Tfb2